MASQVSVIIPVYNTAEYLRECLDSVQNQSLKDMEIICIDDGSTDGSGAICEEYAARDSRFIVLRQDNQGQAAARNRGLDLASGEYVALVDSDDTIDPDYCLLMRNKAETENADYVSCFCSLKGPLKIWWRSLIHSRRQQTPTLTEKTRRAFCAGSGIWRLWKRDVLEKGRIRFTPGLLYEDVEFNIRTLAAANRAALVFKPLYRYRQRQGSTVYHSRNGLRSPAMFESLFRAISPEPFFADFESYYYNMKWRALAAQYRRYRKTPDLGRELVETIRQYATPLEQSGRLIAKVRLSCRAHAFYRTVFRQN